MRVLVLLGRLDTKTATWIIVALGVLLRILALVWTGSWPLEGDAKDYHLLALKLLEGARFEPDWPPGVPYSLAALYTVLGASPLAARIGQLAIYLLLCATIFAMTDRLAGRRTSNLALLVLALTPINVLHSITPLSQLHTALFLCLAALLALQLRERATWLGAILLGLCLAALVLVRSSNIVLVLAFPIVLASWLRRPRLAIVPLAVVALLVGAWLVKAHQLTGRFVFINNANSANIFYGNNPYTPLYRTWWFGSHRHGPGVPAAYTALHGDLLRQPVEQRDGLYLRQALRHIADRPDLFLLRTLSRIRAFFAFDSYTGSLLAAYGQRRLFSSLALGLDALFYLSTVVLLVALLCVRRALEEPLRFALKVCGVLALLFAGPFWASFSHPTYHFPVVVLFTGFGAVFLAAPSAIAHRWRFWISIAVLGAIQVEWVLSMGSRL